MKANRLSVMQKEACRDHYINFSNHRKKSNGKKEMNIMRGKISSMCQCQCLYSALHHVRDQGDESCLEKMVIQASCCQWECQWMRWVDPECIACAFITHFHVALHQEVSIFGKAVNKQPVLAGKQQGAPWQQSASNWARQKMQVKGQ